MRMSKEMTKPLLKEIKAVVSKERKSGKQDNTPYVIVLKKDGFHLALLGDTKPLLNDLETGAFIDDVREARHMENLTYYTAAFPGEFLNYLEGKGLLGDGDLKALCVKLNEQFRIMDDLLNKLGKLDISSVGTDLTPDQIRYALKLTNYFKCDFSTTTYTFNPLFNRSLSKIFKDTGLDDILYELENNSKVSHEVSDLLKQHSKGVNYLFTYCKKMAVVRNTSGVSVAKKLLTDVEYLSNELYYLEKGISEAAKARANFVSKL